MKKALILLLTALLALSFVACSQPDNNPGSNSGGSTENTTTTERKHSEVEVTARTMDLFVEARAENSTTSSGTETGMLSRAITINSLNSITYTIDKNGYSAKNSTDSIAADSTVAITITEGSYTITINATVTLDGVKYSISGTASASISDTGISLGENAFTLAINDITVQESTVKSLITRLNRLQTGETLADSDIGKRVGTLIMKAYSSGQTSFDTLGNVKIDTTYTDKDTGDTILAGATAQFKALAETTISINATAILDAATFTMSGSATIENGKVQENGNTFTLNGENVSDEDVLAIVKAMGLPNSSTPTT